MRRPAALGIVLVLGTAGLLSLVLSSTSATTCGELLRAPEGFDKKTVTLTGTAEDVRLRTSRRGNDYTTLKINDQTERVNVFSWGRLDVRSGDRVHVRGVFHKVKQVGRYRFFNEVEASSVKRIQ
jgi:DNA polymerase III alpha subunit